MASILTLGLVLVGGCSNAANTSPASAGPSTRSSSGSGGGGGGGGGGGAACEAGSHAGPAGDCEASITGWSAGPLLLEKRDHHATFVASSNAGPFLYVLGGIQNSSKLLSSVERAALAADGSVGAWAAGPKLPEVMGGHMIATVDRTVVITGGIRAGAEMSAKAEVATVQPDGNLSAWSEGPAMSVGRFHHGMVAYKDSLYVVGGLTVDDSHSTPLVERAVVSPDGTLGGWSTLTPLPTPRSHHGLAVYGDALYVTAGITVHTGGVGLHENLKDVLRAPILSDGTIGAWVTVGELPTPLQTHSSFAHLGFLYVVGGIEDDVVDTDHVRRAAIEADGTLGTWEDVASLPKPHAHDHHTPVNAGFVYSAGGALDHISTSDVYIGQFE